MEADAQGTLRALEDLRPDLLIADMQLPGMEGSALAKRILGSFSLPVRPAVILLRYPEFPVADEEILASAGITILEKPLQAKSFSAVIEEIRRSEPVFSGMEHRRADVLLNALGVPEHRGRDCLHTAILLCASDERFRRNLGRDLYPCVGRICSLDAAQAERAMRHAINLAWQSDKFDNQYRIFADTVDAGRGQPTCSEMISRLADILRLEG